MTFETVQQLFESGGTFAFALLVWWELRLMRTDMTNILVRLDERTKKE